MQKLRMNRRSIEPIIATLLLVAIAVAAAVVTYSWVMAMVGTQSSQSQTKIQVDFVQFGTGSDANKVYVTVRNTGSLSATIDKIYITASNGTVGYGATGTIDILTYTSTPGAGHFSPYTGYTTAGQIVPVANTTKFTCYLTGGSGAPIGAFTTSQPYKIQVMTSTGFYTGGTYYKP
jgi:flagellin-like protein